jgi:hypothetical protein
MQSSQILNPFNTLVDAGHTSLARADPLAVVLKKMRRRTRGQLRLAHFCCIAM